jgi:signal transduction histidine kinase
MSDPGPSRLRCLLAGNAAVASDLSLPMVLRHTLAAAQDLVQARCVALGVVQCDGGPEQFTGGPPAEGEGVLAVPILVRERVFGTLYLADGVQGAFSAEDEQLVTALAVTAGVAIANAQLYQENEQQRSWLTASTELTQQLFAGTFERPLEAVLDFAVRGAGADMASLTMPINDTQASVQAAAGALASTTGQVVELDHTLAGRVIRSGKAVLLSDWEAEFGAVIGVPLLAAHDRVLGALIVARLPGRPVFTETDKQLLAGFAGHAGLALELDRARVEHESLSKIADHGRIAADLHDHVIQELFATGMGMESLIGGLSDPRHRARMSGLVDSLDATIRRIRTTIFQLEVSRPAPDNLQQRLLSVLDEEHAALGFEAGIAFSGAVGLGVPIALADDLVAVLREAISNTARHANATSVEVRVSLNGAVVTLDITDNGCGVGTTTRSSGLANLRRRAEARGGALLLAVPAGGGTHLRWTGQVA